MREIKFRAWMDDRMYQNVHLEKFGEWIGISEVMQFTGLKDKNGKEIWEGDVVTNNDQPWEVYYADGAWRLVLRGDEKRPNDHLLLLEDKHSEVVGNIYEN